MIKIVKQYSHQELLKMPKISCANSYESDTDNIVKVKNKLLESSYSKSTMKVGVQIQYVNLTNET